MAFGFFPNYNKAGKGVSKDEPPKRGFFRFFDIVARKFWKMVTLNLLYVLFCIPFFIVVFMVSGFISNSVMNVFFPSIYVDTSVVFLLDLFIRAVISFLFMALWGMGPATAGLSYILRNYAREDHAWIWSDFWHNFKSNFVQSMIVWILDLFVMVALYTAFVYYGRMPAPISYLQYFVFLLALLYTFMHFYIYQIMVTFKVKIKDLYKNSLLFALGNIPCTLRIFVILLATFIALLGSAMYFFANLSPNVAFSALIIFLFLLLIIAYSFWGFIVNFNVNTKLIKFTLAEEANIKKEDE